VVAGLGDSDLGIVAPLDARQVELRAPLRVEHPPRRTATVPDEHGIRGAVVHGIAIEWRGRRLVGRGVEVRRDVEVDAHRLEPCRGVQEMRRDPEHGPPLAVRAAQAEDVAHIAVLRVVRLLDLLSLTAERIDQLSATAIHHRREALQLRTIQVRTHAV